MPRNESAYELCTAAPSRLRTELNVVAAVIAVALSVVILALLANTPASRSHHHARQAGHAPRVAHATRVGRAPQVVHGRP